MNESEMEMWDKVCSLCSPLKNKNDRHLDISYSLFSEEFRIRYMTFTEHKSTQLESVPIQPVIKFLRNLKNQGIKEAKIYLTIEFRKIQPTQEND